MMSEDRLMVAQAVMAGQIAEYHLSQEEIDELFEIACNAATEQLLMAAQARGCSVFDGIEGDTVQ